MSRLLFFVQEKKPIITTAVGFYFIDYKMAIPCQQIIKSSEILIKHYTWVQIQHTFRRDTNNGGNTYDKQD